MPSIILQTKTCTKCLCVKNTTEFSKATSSKDGLNYWCRVCSNAQRVAWEKANPEKKKASSAEWIKNNHARKNASRVAWNNANKPRIAELRAILDAS